VDVKVSVITDELSSDLETALELACEFGFQGVELRGIGEGRYPRVSDLMKIRTPELLAEYKLPVVSISPGLFKIPYPEAAPIEARALRWDDALSFGDGREAADRLAFHIDELLPASIEAARAVGSPLINCFSFDRGTKPLGAPVPESIVKILRHAARAAAAKKLSLSIENEVSCWGATARTSAELIGHIGQSNAGITWDPANSYRAGEDRPFPDGYRVVRRIVKHVHFKNARIDTKTGARGFHFDGVVDWVGQLEALRQDGYKAYVSVETHQRPKLITTRRYLELFQRILSQKAHKRDGKNS
jgi:sugar phosphate isomerase/epimerase